MPQPAPHTGTRTRADRIKGMTPAQRRPTLRLVGGSAMREANRKPWEGEAWVPTDGPQTGRRDTQHVWEGDEEGNREEEKSRTSSYPTTKVTREILDTLDSKILEENMNGVGTGLKLQRGVEQVEEMLLLNQRWPAPNEIYAGTEWELGIVWHGRTGSLEIGTEREGTLTFFTERWDGREKKSGAIGEGEEPMIEELRQLFAWIGLPLEGGENGQEG